MLHLPTERFAALADDTPTAAEQAHLAECLACRREHEAHARLRTLAAGEWARIAPPITSWNAIADRLRDEGLVAPAAGRSPAARRAARWGLRAAAAALLVAGGAVGGRWTAGVTPLPVGAAADRPAAPEAAPVLAGPASGDVAVAGDSGVGSVSFASSAEALAALAQAERQYQSAVAFLVQQDSSTGIASEGPAVYRTRLAALDEVTAAAREALYEAPHDPIINRYYLATVGAREATLRQLDRSLPSGTQINRF